MSSSSSSSSSQMSGLMGRMVEMSDSGSDPSCWNSMAAIGKLQGDEWSSRRRRWWWS